MNLTQQQYDDLYYRLDALEDDDLRLGTALPLAPVRAALDALKPQPARPVDWTIHQYPLDMSYVVAVEPHYQGSERYVRWGVHVCISSTTVPTKFRLQAADLVRGGVRVALQHPSYNYYAAPLLRNGTFGDVIFLCQSGPPYSYYCPIGKNATDLIIPPAAALSMPDGPAHCWPVPVDASGRELGLMLNYPPFAMTFDTGGTAHTHPYTIKQSTSYDWLRTVRAQCWQVIPVALDEPRAYPIDNPPPRVPFDVSTDQMMLHQIVPFREGNITRSSISTRGNRTSETAGPYFFAQIRADMPNTPRTPGPRGIGVVSQAIALHNGRRGGVYFNDSHSRGLVDANGNVERFLGIGHRFRPYHGDAKTTPAIETLGEWDSSIPADKRFPKESWAMYFRDTDLVTDETAQPIGNPPEKPHPGPVRIYLPCAFGRIIIETRNGHDRSAPSTATLLTDGASDPWGLGGRGKLIIVNERTKHRVAKYDADSGVYLGDLLNTPSAVANVTGGLNIDRRWVLSSAWSVARSRTLPLIAPEGGALMDDWWYVGSQAQERVIRINIVTGAIEVCCYPPMSTSEKSLYMYISVSDGSTSPRHTIAVSTWSENRGGMPAIFPPSPGVAPDGTPLTHAKELNWRGDSLAQYVGAGGHYVTRRYATATDLRNSMISFASSTEGIGVFTKRMPGDPAAPDAARMQAGLAEYQRRSLRFNFSDTGEALVDRDWTWGEHAAMDDWYATQGWPLVRRPT